MDAESHESERRNLPGCLLILIALACPMVGGIAAELLVKAAIKTDPVPQTAMGLGLVLLAGSLAAAACFLIGGIVLLRRQS